MLAVADRLFVTTADGEFQAVFDQELDHVWRTLRYFGVPAADVEDAAQEVFIVVHRKLADFEGRSSVRTWVSGICLGIARNRRRRASAVREIVTDEPGERSTDATPERELEEREAREHLAELLATLHEDRRAVFVLHEIEEMPMKDVADVVGCTVATAYYRHQTARRELASAAKRRGQR